MIDTKWIVFSGAPCSGKTTVLNQLQERGYRCVPEVARMYLESELAKGRDLESIRENEGEFQRDLVLIKAEIEEKLNPQEIVFLDRAMPDSISYYKLAGLNSAEVIGLSNRFHYHQVFLFDRLLNQIDHVRKESDHEREKLEEYLYSDYESLNYEVIRVPIMSVDERIAFVLQYLPDEKAV